MIVAASKKRYLFIAVSVLIIQLVIGMLFSGIIAAQAAPAGCAGGPAGPPLPGTICPDGSIPVPDPNLPLGCPGSAAQGQPAPNYSTTCPARPGRAECTYSVNVGDDECASNMSSTGGEDRIDLEATCKTTPEESLNAENCGIFAYLVTFINVLSALVGIVVVGMIIMGGIQYAMSADDPQKVSAAKDKIRNAIIALVTFIFTFAFLQWIVPGGVL